MSNNNATVLMINISRSFSFLYEMTINLGIAVNIHVSNVKIGVIWIFHPRFF